MNGGKLSYAADFDELAQIQNLLAAADVVIESRDPRRWPAAASAPKMSHREMVGYGCGSPATALTASGPTGRAFGNDAAVSGGLVGTAGDGPVFRATPSPTPDGVARRARGIRVAEPWRR